MLKNGPGRASAAAEGLTSIALAELRSSCGGGCWAHWASVGKPAPMGKDVAGMALPGGGSSYTLLTYATHAQGTFAELVAAAPGMRVGGWGEKWRSYLQKIEFVHHVCITCDPSHVLIFVDAFDTSLRRPPEEAVRRFREVGAPVLVSGIGFERSVPPLLRRLLFACSSGSACANTGLYMGTAGALREVLEMVLSLADLARDDDQRALELARQELRPGSLRVDLEGRVFLNLRAGEALPEGADPVFVGRNGTAAFASLRAFNSRAIHYGRLLSQDLLLASLTVVLALVWRSARLPLLSCCGGGAFPALVLLVALFAPAPSACVWGVVTLSSLFVLASHLAPW